MSDDFGGNFDTPVVHLRWWGSYIGPDNYYGTGVKQFYIGFSSDVPRSPVNPYAHPGTRLLEQYVAKGPLAPASGTFTETLIRGPDLFGDSLYEYNAELKCPFQANNDTIYWLTLVPLIDDDPTRDGPIVWGWHSRDWTVQNPQASAAPAVEHGEFVFGEVPSTPPLPIWHFQGPATRGIGFMTSFADQCHADTNQVATVAEGYSQVRDGLPPGAFDKDLAFELYTIPEPATVVFGFAALAAAWLWRLPGLRSYNFKRSGRFLGTLTFLIGYIAGDCGVAKAQPPIEVVFNANADQRSYPLVANRNSQIFTIFHTAGSGTDRLLFFGDNLSRRLDSPGTNLLNPAFSNYGMAAYDFRTPLRVRAAALNGPIELIYEVGPNGSLTEPSINDTGVVGFLGRATNQHGLRDAYLDMPGQPLVTLPDLGEDSQREQPLLDEDGRLISVHQYSDYRTELRRYSPTLGSWENLTPTIAGEILDTSNYLLGGGRPAGLDGDFIFGTVRTTGGRTSLFRYDDATATVRRILDTTSATGQTMPAWVFFADNGALLIAADNFNASFPERKVVFQRPDGAIVNLAASLPAGESFVGAPQLPQMNFAGDVWLSTRDVATGQFNYYVYRNAQLLPVMQDTTLRLDNVRLTNDHHVYFWTADGTSFDLARIVVIPEPGTYGLATCAFFCFLWKARSCRAPGRGR
jgi:hypothetical protein